MDNVPSHVPSPLCAFGSRSPPGALRHPPPGGGASPGGVLFPLPSHLQESENPPLLPPSGRGVPRRGGGRTRPSESALRQRGFSRSWGGGAFRVELWNRPVLLPGLPALLRARMEQTEIFEYNILYFNVLF